MSIDFYAFSDAQQKGLECRESIGAASLLFENESTLFPEFTGRDLKSMYPGIRYLNACRDGDSCLDILANEKIDQSSLEISGEALITLTIGGNDLLLAFRKSISDGPAALISGLEALKQNYVQVIGKIQKLFPRATFMVSSVYDPTDGTGVLPTKSPLFGGQMPLEYLTEFNTFIRAIACRRGLPVAELRQHFAGHGALCGSTKNFWYFAPSPIETSYVGASEIRRVWLDTLKP